MQITIEDNAFMYIYLKSRDQHKKIGKCICGVRCFLLYDDEETLIGLRMSSTRNHEDISLNGIPITETIKLPNVGYVDTPLYNAAITEAENETLIMFDNLAVIHHVREYECNITLCKEGILGIEPIPFVYIGGTEIIKPFIITDELLVTTKLE